MKKFILMITMVTTMLLSSCSTDIQEKTKTDVVEETKTDVVEKETPAVETKEEIGEKVDRLIEEAEDKSTIVYISYFDTAMLVYEDFDEWTDKKIEYEEKRAQTLISEMKKKGYKLENVFRVSHGKFDSLIYYIFEIEE